MNMTNEEKILEMLVQLQTDVSGMKNRLGSMEEQMNQLDDKSQRTAVLLETEINHKLDLLYEGHGMIMEHLDKLASKSRVEELESDVVLLKDAVKLMRLEIEALKKAQ